MWVQLAVAIVFALISYALSPKPPKPHDAIAGKLDIPHPPIGEPIGVIFGEVWVKDSGVLYYGNSFTRAIKTDSGK